jgi:hypothetical protein
VVSDTTGAGIEEIIHIRLSGRDSKLPVDAACMFVQLERSGRILPGPTPRQIRL